jgi:hypothetical protein
LQSDSPSIPHCSSFALCLSRSRPGDLGEDEEESEGTVGEQDLKGTYKQLVQGVQEWQDGCVYKGEFGLNMKLGYGEFSWPTGEVGSFSRALFLGAGVVDLLRDPQDRTEAFYRIPEKFSAHFHIALWGLRSYG